MAGDPFQNLMKAIAPLLQQCVYTHTHTHTPQHKTPIAHPQASGLGTTDMTDVPSAIFIPYFHA